MLYKKPFLVSSSYICLSFIVHGASLKDILISTELELKFHGGRCVVANIEWGFLLYYGHRCGKCSMKLNRKFYLKFAFRNLL